MFVGVKDGKNKDKKIEAKNIIPIFSYSPLPPLFTHASDGEL